MSLQPPPPTIEYASPQVARPQRPLTSIRLTIVLLLPTILLYIAAFITVRRFEPMFKDFKTELPGITILMLGFSRWIMSWGWAVFWLVPVIVPIVLTQVGLAGRRAADPAQRSRRDFWTVYLSAALSFAVLLLVALALMMPMISLIQTVSSPKR